MGNIINLESESTNPLFGAIRTGNLALIKRLLHEGAASIKDTDPDGKTAVIYAACTGHLDIVKWMITEGGARADEIDNDERTCLLGAAKNGKLDVVKWLLNEGYSDISERNVDEMTCLLNAAWYGRLNIVQWLIEENVESVLEKTTREGMTALHLAAKGGHLNVVKWLLKKGGAKISDADNNGHTVLSAAILSPNLDVVHWLLGEGNYRIVESDDALIIASDLSYGLSHDDRLALVKLLVKNGVNISYVDKQKRTAILCAAGRQRYDIVLWFLNEGGEHVTEELWKKLGWPTVTNFLCEDGLCTKPRLLFRTMLLMGPPPNGEPNSPEMKEFVRRICLHAKKLRARFPHWLGKQNEAILHSIPRLPKPLVSIFSSYSAPSVDDIWSDELGVLNVTTTATTPTTRSRSQKRQKKQR